MECDHNCTFAPSRKYCVQHRGTLVAREARAPLDEPRELVQAQREAVLLRQLRQHLVGLLPHSYKSQSVCATSVAHTNLSSCATPHPRKAKRARDSEGGPGGAASPPTDRNAPLATQSALENIHTAVKTTENSRKDYPQRL